MKEQEFFQRLAMIFDADENSVDLDYKFSEVAWDSLSLLATIAAIDEFFDVNVPVKSIETTTTVKELMGLIKKAADNEKNK